MRMRKDLLAAALLAAITMTVPAFAQDPCSWSQDVRLVNGKFYTMDTKNTVVNEVTIQNGKFAYLGKLGNRKLNPCTRIIDVGGRTVVPGLIDGHNHYGALGMVPGYDVRLETAWSIADVLNLIRERVKTAPPRGFLTTMAGWNAIQFAEKRAPTIAELDQAAPNNPYFGYPNGTTGPIMNSRAKAYLQAKGLKITADGKFDQTTSQSDVFRVLRADQTMETMKRGIMDADTYSVSLGLVTNVDGGLPYLCGSPDLKGASESPHGMESFNPWTAHRPWLAVNSEGKLKGRVRFYWYGQDTRPDIPLLTEHLLHTFPYFGDDKIRFSGIGERPVSWGGGFGGNCPESQPQNTAQAGGRGQGAQGAAQGGGGGGGQQGTGPPENFERALMLIAQYGWSFIHHAIQANESKMIMETMERVNKVYPIANLRWSLLHTADISDDTLNRLKAMGAGVQPNAYPYISAVGGNATAPAGPPFRRILDNGIRVTGGSGCVGVCGLNPWLMIYYMVTGRNAAGEMKNAGNQITRMEALRLYTAAPPWFFKEEDKLGSIEVGKLGDVTVLSADYTDPGKVSDQEIRNLKSVLTVVDGKVVWDTLNSKRLP